MFSFFSLQLIVLQTFLSLLTTQSMRANAKKDQTHKNDCRSNNRQKDPKNMIRQGASFNFLIVQCRTNKTFFKQFRIVGRQNNTIFV